MPHIVVWYIVFEKRASWGKTEDRKSDDHFEKWTAVNKETDRGTGPVDCTRVYKEKGKPISART